MDECDRPADGGRGLCTKHYSRAFYRGNQQRWQLRRLYGISVEEFEALLAQQAGVCRICRKTETSVDPRTGTTRKLAVDHDHATGVVRGLLCHKCNWAIGLFADDADLLRRAAAYLEPLD